MKYPLSVFLTFFRESRMLFIPSSVRSGIIAWKSSTAEKIGSRAAWACPVKSCDCTVSPFVFCFFVLSSFLTRQLEASWPCACVQSSPSAGWKGLMHNWSSFLLAYCNRKWGHWTLCVFTEAHLSHLVLGFSLFFWKKNLIGHWDRALSSSFFTSDPLWTQQHIEEILNCRRVQLIKSCLGHISPQNLKNK